MQFLVTYVNRAVDDLQVNSKPAKRPRNVSLKEVEILGYSAQKDEISTYLIENAISLEKIIVSPALFYAEPYKLPKNCLGGSPFAKEVDVPRDHPMYHLKQKLLSTIEFICL